MATASWLAGEVASDGDSIVARCWHLPQVLRVVGNSHITRLCAVVVCHVLAAWGRAQRHAPSKSADVVSDVHRCIASSGQIPRAVHDLRELRHAIQRGVCAHWRQRLRTEQVVLALPLEGESTGCPCA